MVLLRFEVIFSWDELTHCETKAMMASLDPFSTAMWSGSLPEESSSDTSERRARMLIIAKHSVKQCASTANTPSSCKFEKPFIIMTNMVHHIKHTLSDIHQAVVLSFPHLLLC